MATAPAGFSQTNDYLLEVCSWWSGRGVGVLPAIAFTGLFCLEKGIKRETELYNEQPWTVLQESHVHQLSDRDSHLCYVNFYIREIKPRENKVGALGGG